MPHDTTPSTGTPQLACSVFFPSTNSPHPPMILIHGAANSAAVWRPWQEELAAQGWATYAPDLRGHGHNSAVDLAHVSMTDYAEDVQTLVQQLRQPPVVVGWSMGGLVALMVAASGSIAACVTLAPSMPAQQVDAAVALRSGVFTAEVYGIISTDPADQPAMPDLTLEERQIALASLGPESQRARDERQRGIVIEALPCPLLIVTGTLDTQWPRARYDNLWLPAERLQIDGASHWGLVLNGRALTTHMPRIIDWLEGVL